MLEGTLLRKETMVDPLRELFLVLIYMLELEEAEPVAEVEIIQVHLKPELVVQDQHQQLLELQSQELAEAEDQLDTDPLGQDLEDLAEPVDQVAAEQEEAEVLLNQQETEHQQQLTPVAVEAEELIN
jgi:hypothetical protein